MAKRESVLAWMRIAGYHGDHREFARLFIENRISKTAANEAFSLGLKQRKAGMPCHCIKCKEKETP
jgi:hypothetical protein